jgi:hypothetical protein
LAVTSSWALFGTFGLCFVLSGFSLPLVPAILGGFALFVAGFISHLIINVVFHHGFTTGEIVTGLVAFGVGLACFIAAVIPGAGIAGPEFVVGISGFATLVLCFLVYLIIKFGLKGAFSRFHARSHAGEDSLGR